VPARSGGRLLALLIPVVGAACGGAPAGPRPSASPAAPAAVATPAALPSPLPEVAARVNDQPIATLSVMIVARQGLNPKSTLEEIAPAARRALDQLVVRELLFQEALRQGVEADPRRLEQAYNESRIPFREETAWVAFLKDQAMTDESFRRELRVKLTVEALVARLVAGLVRPSEDELRAAFEADKEAFGGGERLRIAHILLRVDPAPPAQRVQARQVAEKLLADLRQGADFGALARQLSGDKESAARGGELQPFARGALVKPLEDAAFALKPGELGGPVDSPAGVHVLRLLERLPPAPLRFESVRDEVLKRSLDRHRDAAVERLISELRGRARIERAF